MISSCSLSSWANISLFASFRFWPLDRDEKHHKAQRRIAVRKKVFSILGSFVISQCDHKIYEYLKRTMHCFVFSLVQPRDPNYTLRGLFTHVNVYHMLFVYAKCAMWAYTDIHMSCDQKYSLKAVSWHNFHMTLGKVLYHTFIWQAAFGTNRKVKLLSF